MSIALMITDRQLEPLVNALSAQLPNENIKVWPDVEFDESVEFVIAWRYPKNMWQMFPNLKVVSSLGAGVDELIKDELRPQHIKLTRIVDSDLSNQMAQYCLTVLLMYQSRMHEYQHAQVKKQWRYFPKRESHKVTVLGAGEIGLVVAKKLHLNGFEVNSWSQSSKNETFISQSFTTKNELYKSVAEADFVISILPSTPETDNLINIELLKAMPKHAVIINTGRGNVVNESDLATALTEGIIGGATLDVFKQEPLPDEHVFWNVPNLQITPHISAISSQSKVVDQIVENYQLFRHGKSLKHQVDVNKGY